jgi:hypothetical protein
MIAPAGPKLPDGLSKPGSSASPATESEVTESQVTESQVEGADRCDPPLNPS